MDCKYLHRCGSCALTISYNEQKKLKIAKIKELFGKFYSGEFEFFQSNETGFRSRAEFGIWHEDGDISYCMRGVNSQKLPIDSCQIVDLKISNLMPRLLNAIKDDEALVGRLFGVEFISSAKSLVATLLYHKDINQIYDNLARLQSRLEIGLIARSRGVKLEFGNVNIDEILMVNGRKFYYTMSDTAFIQPNRNMNEKMISWAVDGIMGGADLIELYCGHGNFTIPISFKFQKVLATEISKSSIDMALKNCKLNSVNNIKFARLSAAEIMSAMAKEREFERLRGVDLDSYKFSHILVDPPRAGCEDSVLKFMSGIDNIIYISCNPHTLRDNLNILSQTHKVVKFAIFDQFVHTNHIECGVILEKFN
ncbi:tRNA (uridine(54)-C5)-methyltransferase TrmA [Campylobacter sp. CX2-8023-23]|uniref:tRNA (Uridine(54)-C5)-methyltransferase TrmA n=1 Tax=Campylobacter porcelli TaxID=1660073 RepID=A0ABU7M2E6_9BACT|nr:tRNA (uridine(54)-C5)-methyltransferase TrmA [Campylobacter sp. CX2-8023-23]MEE3743872.1 tRNA (uridine(54)-C5)-methyltransferase TrmA [Campylobacter sp. CX2-4855-23]